MDMNFTTSSGKTFTLPMETSNVNAVRQEITKNDFPHPVVMTCIGSIMIIMIYIIYICCIKTNLSGIWYCDGDQIKISHNTFLDTIVINHKIRGYVIGNAIYVKSNGTKCAILHDKKIFWVGNTDVWTRPVHAT